MYWLVYSLFLSGELRHIQKLRFWPLDAVLTDKYLLPREEAEMIASFLTPMLRLHPDKRARASELIHHAWLDGVLVQGEIDIIRRAEEEELRKREAAATRRAGGPSASGAAQVLGPESRAKLARAEERHNVELQTDMDALKPVDETLGVELDQVVDAEEDERVSVTQVPTATAGAKENLIMKPAPTGRAGHQHQPHPSTIEESSKHRSSKKRS